MKKLVTLTCCLMLAGLLHAQINSGDMFIKGGL